MVSMEEKRDVEMRGDNKIAVLDPTYRQPKPLRLWTLAYSSRERYGYRFCGVKGGLMKPEEVLSRRAHVDALCGEFLISKALERAVLNGDTDPEEVVATPETDAAEEDYRAESRSISPLTMLTVSRGIV